MKDRGGNLERFFQHENQTCPPALSGDSCIHLGAINQLLSSLEDLCEPTAEGSPTRSIVIVEQSSSICCVATVKNFKNMHSLIPYPT